MAYPKIRINKQKIANNLNVLSQKIQKAGLTTTAITKVFSADKEMMELYDACKTIDYLGDSRIQNIKKYKNSRKEKVLIRTPMLSEVSEVVKYADISFNSNYHTVSLLNQEALKQNKVHKVLLMVDLGDLREGYYYQEEFINDTEKMKALSSVEVIGIGVNLTCYGAIIPDENNLGELIKYKELMEESFGYELTMVSGGNSSSLYLLDDEQQKLPNGINNLRLGEAIVLGRETAYGREIEGTYQDVFELQAELIEVKKKPSLPTGNSGMNAFGEKPIYQDKGIMKRGIVALGKQDVSEKALYPRDPTIQIVGSSSDHLLVDLTKCSTNYQVGDKLLFDIEYGSLLSAFTSDYITKEYY